MKHKPFTIRPTSIGSTPVTINASSEKEAAERFAETVGLVAFDFEVPQMPEGSPASLIFKIGTGRKFIAYDAALEQ